MKPQKLKKMILEPWQKISIPPIVQQKQDIPTYRKQIIHNFLKNTRKANKLKNRQTNHESNQRKSSDKSQRYRKQQLQVGRDSRKRKKQLVYELQSERIHKIWKEYQTKRNQRSTPTVINLNERLCFSQQSRSSSTSRNQTNTSYKNTSTERNLIRNPKKIYSHHNLHQTQIQNISNVQFSDNAINSKNIQMKQGYKYSIKSIKINRPKSSVYS